MAEHGSLSLHVADKLHLTKVAGVVQMRPQFHHVDAAVQQEKLRLRKPQEIGDTGHAAEPRAVQMTTKATDDDNVDFFKTSKSLTAAEAEPWLKLRYFDEDVCMPT